MTNNKIRIFLIRVTCSPLSLRKLPDPGFNPKDQFTRITFVWPIKLRMSRSADQVDGKGASLLLGERCVTSRKTAAKETTLLPQLRQSIPLLLLLFFLLTNKISDCIITSLSFCWWRWSPLTFSFLWWIFKLSFWTLKNCASSKLLPVVTALWKKNQNKKTQANNELHPNQHSSGIKSGCFIDKIEREREGGRERGGGGGERERDEFCCLVFNNCLEATLIIRSRCL